MTENSKKTSVWGAFILLGFLLNVLVLQEGFIVHEKWYRLLLLTIPLQLIAIGAYRKRLW